MPRPELHSLGDALFWAYASLGMLESTLEQERSKPGRVQYMIRSRLFRGLRDGSMNVRGFFDDERLKAILPQACWYCGETANLSMDHIIPRSRGGGDTGENLITVCRSCNSSKGGRDLLVWMKSRDRFPALYLYRRYLKLAIDYARKHDLLETPIEAAQDSDLPFDVGSILEPPPAADMLCLFVPSKAASA